MQTLISGKRKSQQKKVLSFAYRSKHNRFTPLDPRKKKKEKREPHLEDHLTKANNKFH